MINHSAVKNTDYNTKIFICQLLNNIPFGQIHLVREAVR